MKVGHIINGLTVTDVKRVNKLNLIQFLKEVDNYLQQGYQIDVTSGRQVGLVLQADMFKTEQPFGEKEDVKVKVTIGEPELIKQESTNTLNSPSEGTTQKYVPEETVGTETVVTESTVQQEQVTDEVVVEPVVDTVKEEAPVAPKKTTTRSKKTAQ